TKLSRRETLNEIRLNCHARACRGASTCFCTARSKTRMAGTSPAMTQEHVELIQSRSRATEVADRPMKHEAHFPSLRHLLRDPLDHWLPQYLLVANERRHLVRRHRASKRATGGKRLPDF